MSLIDVAIIDGVMCIVSKHQWQNDFLYFICNLSRSLKVTVNGKLEEMFRSENTKRNTCRLERQKIPEEVTAGINYKQWDLMIQMEAWFEFLIRTYIFVKKPDQHWFLPAPNGEVTGTVTPQKHILSFIEIVSYLTDRHVIWDTVYIAVHHRLVSCGETLRCRQMYWSLVITCIFNHWWRENVAMLLQVLSFHYYFYFYSTFIITVISPHTGVTV